MKYAELVNNKIAQFCTFLIITIFLSTLMIDSFHPNSNLVEGHDTNFHLSRLISMSVAIEEDSHSAYIDYTYLDGYGYGVNLFYPSFMLYPFATLVKPFGIVAAYRASLYFAFIVGAIIAFFAIRRTHHSNKTAVIFSWLYTFALYKLIVMSTRGAWAEMFAFTFVPLVYWGLYEIIYGNYKKYWYILSIGFACIILTHLLSAFMVFCAAFILLILFAKFFIKDPKRLLYLLYSGVLCILLSCFFTFPMLEQMMHDTFYYKTNPAISDMLQELVPFREVLWGMFSGLTDSPYRIASLGLILTLATLARAFIKERTGRIKFADLLVIVGLVFTIATTTIFPWKIIPHQTFSIIQFPWRLLGLSTFCFALGGSIYLSTLLQSKRNTYALFGLLVILIAIQLKGTGSAFKASAVLSTYSASNDNIPCTVSGGEYIPSAVPSKLYPSERGQNKIESTDKLSTTSKIERQNGYFIFHITSFNGEKQRFILPLLSYKGYEATLNEKVIPIKQSKDGLMEITADEPGEVKVWYAGTFIQKISVYISLISLITLIAYLTYIKRKKKKEKHSILV